MHITLLAILIALIPSLALASGANIPTRPGNFLLIITDDISGAAQLCDGDDAQGDCVDVPALDPVNEMTHFARTYSEPMCGPTRVSLNAMSTQSMTWGRGGAGSAWGPAGAAWIPRHLEGTNIEYRLFGKAHMWQDMGYCTGDGTIACFHDSTCVGNGTCAFITAGQGDTTQAQGLADIGWSSTIWSPSNPADFNDWTVQTSEPSLTDRLGHTLTSVSGQTDYKESYMVEQFDLWWNEASRATERKYVIFNTGNAHAPVHQPPGEVDSSFDSQVEYAYNTTVTDLLAIVDADKTCVIIMPDNGHVLTPPSTPYRGAKTDVYEGGIRPGSVWSESCFADGNTPSTSREISARDVGRYGLELLNAYDETLFEDTTFGFDNRTNDATRPNVSSSLMGWARGRCSSSECRADPQAHIAWASNTSQPVVGAIEDGYKLLFHTDVENWLKVVDVDDEYTYLCESDSHDGCRAQLSGLARTAFDDIWADLIFQTSMAADHVCLSFGLDGGGTTLADGSNAFRLSNACGTGYDANWNNPYTRLFCAIDWDDGPVEHVQDTPTQDFAESAFDSYMEVTHTYSTPGTYSVAWTCHDLMDLGDPLTGTDDFILSGGAGPTLRTDSSWETAQGDTINAIGDGGAWSTELHGTGLIDVVGVENGITPVDGSNMLRLGVNAEFSQGIYDTAAFDLAAQAWYLRLYFNVNCIDEDSLQGHYVQDFPPDAGSTNFWMRHLHYDTASGSYRMGPGSYAGGLCDQNAGTGPGARLGEDGTGEWVATSWGTITNESPDEEVTVDPYGLRCGNWYRYEARFDCGSAGCWDTADDETSVAVQATLRIYDDNDVLIMGNEEFRSNGIEYSTDPYPPLWTSGAGVRISELQDPDDYDGCIVMNGDRPTLWIGPNGQQSESAIDPAFMYYDAVATSTEGWIGAAN